MYVNVIDTICLYCWYIIDDCYYLLVGVGGEIIRLKCLKDAFFKYLLSLVIKVLKIDKNYD